MNRYQFEDLISDYLENTLNLAQRKDFESYLKSHSEAKLLVENIQKAKDTLSSLPKQSTSPAFMKNLNKRLSVERMKKVAPIQKSYFGFTPLYASVMAGLMFAFIFVSIEIFQPGESKTALPRKAFADESSMPVKPQNETMPLLELNRTDLAESDTTDYEKDEKKKKDYSKKMRFVND